MGPFAGLAPTGRKISLPIVHVTVVREGRIVSRVAYHHTAEAALEAVGGGLAVLLPAPDFDQVQHTLSRGHLLPEKATSFQPKPSLGVLMRSLRDE